MSFIKLTTTVVATAAVSSVSFDVPLDGELTSVLMGVAITGEAALADTMVVNAEASFSSTNQFATSDVRNSLGQCSVTVVGAGAAAAVSTQANVPFFVAHNLKIKVFAGERIFLHLGAPATIDSARAIAYFHIDDGESRSVRPRARRA